MIITHHAIQRYQERVANVPEPDVIAALSTPAIEAAARFGNCNVRFAGGWRAVIIDRVVITVLPGKEKARSWKHCKRQHMDRSQG